jgi:hypothetical protein
VSGENPELNNLEDFLDNLDFPVTQSNLGYCNYVPATGIERFQRRVQHAISLGYENAWRYSAYK